MILFRLNHEEEDIIKVQNASDNELTGINVCVNVVVYM